MYHAVPPFSTESFVPKTGPQLPVLGRFVFRRETSPRPTALQRGKRLSPPPEGGAGFAPAACGLEKKKTSAAIKGRREYGVQGEPYCKFSAFALQRIALRAIRRSCRTKAQAPSWVFLRAFGRIVALRRPPASFFCKETCLSNDKECGNRHAKKSHNKKHHKNYHYKIILKKFQKTIYKYKKTWYNKPCMSFTRCSGLWPLRGISPAERCVCDKFYQKGEKRS